LIDPDPLVTAGRLLLLTYASPVTPYKPTPIAGVSHDSLTGRASGNFRKAPPDLESSSVSRSQPLSPTSMEKD
jgi:hypothetical protein